MTGTTMFDIKPTPIKRIYPNTSQGSFIEWEINDINESPYIVIIIDDNLKEDQQIYLDKSIADKSIINYVKAFEANQQNLVFFKNRKNQALDFFRTLPNAIRVLNENLVTIPSNEVKIFGTELTNRLKEIRLLENNWDGYGGCAPSRETMTLVTNFLDEIPQKYIDLIHFEDVIPSSHGTVRIEWEKDGYFVSIEIGENGSGYYSELSGGEEPYNDNLETIINPVPNEFLEALDKLYNTTL